MSEYVLTISVGPVQGFIAAARKTRDLWAGSQLLSDISKSVAQALSQANAKLIFPGDEVRLNEPQFSVANVVTCTVEADDERRLEEEFVKIARKAAYKKWDDFVDATVYKIGNREEICNDFWDSQTKAEDVVEFYAAWTPILNDDEGKALERAASILAARKNSRDFIQPDYDGSRVPKSSLDGSRESVLKPEVVRRGVKSLYLKRGEQLDAIGLIKRLGVQELEKQQNRYEKDCPSLLRIAIRPRLEKFRDWLENQNLTSVQKNLVYQSGLKLLDDADSLGDLLATPSDEQNDGAQELREIVRNIDESGLYLAILLADGDKMGKALARLNTSEERRKFSQALSEFSSGVAERVEEHGGLCVYAGGDDVLAFLSVDQALDCADKLRLWFKEAMKDYPETSLSAGIVVFHYHETLDQALDFARDAEKVAKKTSDGYAADDPLFGDRNGLAVSYYSRGNAPVTVRERWSDGENSLVNRLKNWGKAFQTEKKSQSTVEARQNAETNREQKSIPGLPGGFPYDLQELIVSQIYRSEEWRGSPYLAEALRRDIMRIIRQKRSISKESDLYRKLETRMNAIQNEEDLAVFVRELIVAKKIGEYMGLKREENGNA